MKDIFMYFGANICDDLRDMVPFLNTHGGLLLLVKLHSEACNFTKSSTLPWVSFTFLKLCRGGGGGRRRKGFNETCRS